MPRAATYVVTSGDCLWSIAARLLGPKATTVAIDREWRAIYAANATSIGSDPNLIHPGLILVLPTLRSHPVKEQPVPTISITPWADPIIDTLGHDPRSEYVERFWLPTLGPTTLLLLRRIATHFDGIRPPI